MGTAFRVNADGGSGGIPGNAESKGDAGAGAKGQEKADVHSEAEIAQAKNTQAEAKCSEEGHAEGSDHGQISYDVGSCVGANQSARVLQIAATAAWDYRFAWEFSFEDPHL